MKYETSKILFLLLIATFQINSMGDNTENWEIPTNLNNLFSLLENIENRIPNAHYYDLQDAQEIRNWFRQYNEIKNQNLEGHGDFTKVPKTLLTKIFNRLDQLTKKYCPLIDFNQNTFSYAPTERWPGRIMPIFEQSINFSSESSSSSSVHTYDDDDSSDDESSDSEDSAKRSTIFSRIFRFLQKKLGIPKTAVDDVGRPDDTVEYVTMYYFYDLPKVAAKVRDTIRNNELTHDTIDSDFKDAQTIYNWCIEYESAPEECVSQATRTKLLDRLYVLVEKYGIGELPDKEHFLIGQTWPIGILPRMETLGTFNIFNKEIHFCSSQGFNNQLLKLVQNRFVIAGGGVIVAATAAWYWFCYLSEPKTEEVDTVETNNQPATIQDVK